MTQMTASNIIDYLEQASKIEYKKYTLEKLKDELTHQIETVYPQKSQAKHTGRLPEMVDTTKPVQYVQEPRKPEAIAKYNFAKIAFPLSIIGFVLSLSLFPLSGAIPGLFNRFENIPGTSSFEIVGALVLYSIVSMIFFYNMKKKNKGEVNKYYADLKKYQEQSIINENNRRHNIEAAERDRIVNAEAQAKWQQEEDQYQNNLLVVLNNEKQLLEKTNSELEELYRQRDLFYSNDVIYGSYRSLIPVCTMLEYFKSGRVNEFVGPYGAYNLYESESRQNVIINNLEQIKSNTRAIAQQQQDMINKLNWINSGINNVMEEVSDANKKAEEISRAASKISFYFN